ncbi:MAG: biotin transporter BioY [Bacillota bacterium]|nr:biotin transporter BioY [Bacillota bacterium]
MQESQVKLSARDLVLTGLSIALITVGAYARITLFVVPFTLQLAFVMLIALAFGHKVGFLSTSLYTVMGLLGIPIFSKGGGLGYIASPSFGYIMGFVACAFVIGYLAGPNKLSGTPASLLGKTFLVTLLGLLIVYTFGVSYWFLLEKIMIQSGASLFEIAYKGAVLFVPKDLFLCLIVSMVGPKLQRIQRLS